MHFVSPDFPRGKTVLEKLSRYGNILDIFDFITGIEAIVIRDWDTFSKLFVAVLCATMLWFTGWILIIASGKGNLAFVLINLSWYKWLRTLSKIWLYKLCFKFVECFCRLEAMLNRCNYMHILLVAAEISLWQIILDTIVYVTLLKTNIWI